MELYDYQQEAVERHMAKRHSINTFTMGLGKTLIALQMHKTIGGKTLVICPKFLIQNWKDEMATHGVGGDIDFVNYAKINTTPLKQYDFIVCDEAHYVKTPSSLRSKGVERLVRCRPPEYLLLLTATPCKNDVSELFNLLQLVNFFHKDKSIEKFKDSLMTFKRHFMKSHVLSLKRRSVTKFYGFKNQQEYTTLYNRYCVRKKLAEVDLPETVHKILRVGDFSLDADFKELTTKFNKEAYMTLKAKTALLLADYTSKYILDFDGQCIIFTAHVKSAAKLSEKLKCPMITGQVKAAEREDIIRRFKSGFEKYLVATYATVGVGYTLTNCNYMVFNDLPFMPSDLDQARGRIRRLSQEKTCFYFYVGMSEMYFKLFNKLRKKAEVLRRITAKDQGI